MPKDIQIWRYSIPTEDGLSGWGIFLLDSTGMFAAVTDYGNYAFKWTHHGMPYFRQFMIGLADSPGYLLGKVAPRGEEYDGDKTIEGIKKHILRYRREGSYNKEFAREEWDIIDEDEMNTEYGFCHWYDNTKLDDAHEFKEESYGADCMAFATKLIPRLAEVLQQELELKEAV